jgi:hypothetical protein
VALGRRHDPASDRLATWPAVIERWCAHARRLPPDERTRLVELAVELAGRVRWEAAKGFQDTEEHRAVIAGHAAVLVLGLDIDAYRNVRSILLTPGAVVDRGPRGTLTRGVVTDSPLAIAGQARPADRLVMLSWAAVRAQSRAPHRGEHVVYHEFAHHLDQLDGVLDGTPPIVDEAARRRWIDVCTRCYDDVRFERGPALLKPYAATGPAEFFAVASELFFTRPLAMRDELTDLYDVLAGYYRQDPATLEER